MRMPAREACESSTDRTKFIAISWRKWSFPPTALRGRASGMPTMTPVDESSPVPVPGLHRIYLIRHGETALNANRTLQLAATPLSDRGLEQAGKLGARLRSAKLARILASDLTRAAMTAE